MRGIGLLLPLVLLISCDGPERQLHRLQRDLLKALPEGAVFLLKENKDTVSLPLPPTAEELTLARDFATEARQKVLAIDPQKLSPQERSTLTRLRAVIDSLSTKPSGALCDPVRYVPLEVLRRPLPPALLVSLVDTLPAYYAAVHERWSAPAPARIGPAVEQAVQALDELTRLEKNMETMPPKLQARLASTLPAARRATKDFIGLLQSNLMVE